MGNQFDQHSLKVADSEFIGYLKPISGKSDAINYQNALKDDHPLAAHVPYSWVVNIDDVDDSGSGFEEDGEPEGSVGPILLEVLKKSLVKTEKKGSYVLIVVRYFGCRLLGVTCGRLSQCYQSIGELTAHRYFTEGSELHKDLTKEPLTQNKYALGAGDCEIILDVIQDVSDPDIKPGDDKTIWVHRIVNELEFGGFRGNKNEELPRLQNLQADISGCLVPAYRYPGNYRGDEWETYQWSPLSLKIKRAVEKNLRPLVEQEMNHCVTNYYRDGKDFIGHHSDKDLDLDKDGVIVSVSFGDERILELKRRGSPADTMRVLLPHGSMLVLGPFTNKLFTHSILTKETSNEARISLTLRRVLTFLDVETGRLFGEGVSTSSLTDVRNNVHKDNCAFLTTALALATVAMKVSSDRTRKDIKTGFISTGLVGLSYISFKTVKLLWCKRQDEVNARAFFSRTSVHGTKY